MPVLHQYKGKDEFYILTAIGGAIVTFQLTREGQQRLKAGGVEPGNKFGRALLLDLYRDGDAFTHGTGTGGSIEEIDTGQLTLDFSNDPEPESLFPICGTCSSLDDLHLVELTEPESSATILCSSCRALKAAAIDTSIPLPLASRALLNKLLDMKRFTDIDKSVKKYQDLLEAEFASRWKNMIASKKTIKQESLFSVDDSGQASLL